MSTAQAEKTPLERLKEKYGDASRIGGKGTQRRKKKTVHKTTIQDDKKFKSTVKKLGMQPLQDIDEVNMFKDDNTIIQFKRPEVFAAFQSNAFAVMGPAETKNLKDILHEMQSQLSMKDLQALAQQFKAEQGGKNVIKEEKDEDDKDEEIPTLVKTNFEEVSNKQ
eukprot:TRINITY_DN1211_c0_g3_i2.p1 TRINITY_DN1211_c0_g3~~TRINITY_DN1211_c0_g3_i2.p1  ORF type:complete len:165 (+),score=68.46 TRINITY_DN1211_c0_g3_i2:118-612(+)